MPQFVIRTRCARRWETHRGGASRPITEIARGIYGDAGLDPSFFDRHRSRRGSIQHGAELPTSSYLDEVFNDLSQVQIAAMVATAKEVGIKPGTITYLSANWPIAIFSCRAKKGGPVDIQLRRRVYGRQQESFPSVSVGTPGEPFKQGWNCRRKSILYPCLQFSSSRSRSRSDPHVKCPVR